MIQRTPPQQTVKKLKKVAKEGKDTISTIGVILNVGTILSALIGLATVDVLTNPYGYAFESKKPYNPNPVIPTEDK